MKKIFALFLLMATGAAAQEKTFGEIVLTNQVDFMDRGYDVPGMGCGFLFKYQRDTFAVTAKHLLALVHPPRMKTLAFDGFVKRWVMFDPAHPNRQAEIHRLINEDTTASWAEHALYTNDLLVFSLKKNTTTVKALEPRWLPVDLGETLYVVERSLKDSGTTQIVQPLIFYRNVRGSLLLKELPSAEKFTAISGAPVLDAQGLLVGWISTPTTDPVTGKLFITACSVEGLLDALKTDKKE